MLRKGDMVKILPEFQDEGDSEYEWVVVGDEEKGRVDISPASIDMRQKPIYTLLAEQVELVQRAR